MCRKKLSPTSIGEKVKHLELFDFFWYFMNILLLVFFSSQIKRLIIPKCTKRWLCSKNSMSKRYSWKKPFSLAKWSNYPSSIGKMVSKKFCPKNLFAILAKFSSICEILALFKKNSMALKYLKRTGQFQVFGFFHGYFINTDFFCYFYTSSND